MEREGTHGADARADVAPRHSAAGYELYMIRPTLNELPSVAFPEGYGMRAMRLDEAGLWTDIQRDAEPYFDVRPGWFQQQFGSDLEAVPQRCYLVVNARGVAVGTISAWYNDSYQGERWGQVHWLAVRPAYQRRGLARAALAYCLAQLARWHGRAYLGTQSERVGAIRLYLEMGFVPDVRHPGARQVWLALGDKVGYPQLRGL
jgi:GNAT superfamily N-acetyltransferase